jgi:hypothetical protein
MVQRRAGGEGGRSRRGGQVWAWETSHTAGVGSISNLLETEQITTSLLVDGNIKEALDL